MKRRDLLIGAVALLGSAGLSAGGAAYLLNANGLAPQPPAPPAADPHAADPHATGHSTPSASASHSTHGTPTAAAGHGTAAAGHGTAAASTDHAAWSYAGASGPEHWGDLEPANAVCKQGGAQSPIDLANPLRVPALTGLQINYGPTRAKVTNNGHTIQVNYDKGSSLTLDGKRFDLLQFHFHTPSEHTVDGKAFPLELHLVHQAADKNLAVIGVMLTEGQPNTTLGKFWERMPRNASEVDSGATINALDLLPRALDDYFTYSGSLTTPPCTESVRWIVLRRPVEMSKTQILAFRNIFSMNARPVAPIGARLLLAS